MATAKKTAKPAAPSSTAVAVVKKGNTAVVALQDRLRQQAAEMASRTSPATGLNITLGAKKFKFPDGTNTTEAVQLVVVDFRACNTFYDRAYDKDNPIPPACFAVGLDPRNLVPSDSSPVKQADDCASCPNNQWGSNGKGKACSNGRVLAVLPPEAHEETPLWLLRVSPTGLRSFDSFVTKVASQLQMPPVAVAVTISFNEGSDYPQLEFGSFEPVEDLGLFAARQDEAGKLLETEPDVSGYVPIAPVKAARPAAKAVRR